MAALAHPRAPGAARARAARGGARARARAPARGCAGAADGGVRTPEVAFLMGELECRDEAEAVKWMSWLESEGFKFDLEKATARLDGMRAAHELEFGGRVKEVPFTLPKTRPGRALLMKQCAVRTGGGEKGGGVARRWKEGGGPQEGEGLQGMLGKLFGRK